MAINIGDRYIIEIAEKYRVEITDGTPKIEDLPPRDLYRVRGIPDTFLSDDNFDKLDKYDSNNDNSYQRGLNDAWEALRMMADKDMSCETLDRLFGEHMLTKIAREYTVTEVIDKLAEYEAKKKEEEEIKVGDEVETDYNGNVIIVEKPKDGWYVTIAKNFARYSIHESHIIKKTGRHFPQVSELLDAMEEGGET